MILPDEIQQHILQQYPREAVVGIYNNEFRPLKNIHKYPESNFCISVSDYSDEITGLIHSHCSNAYKQYNLDPRTPSPNDCINQANMDIPWYIVSSDGKSISTPLQFPANLTDELFGRRFIYGVYDCYEFVRSFYFQKIGIRLSKKPALYDWSNKEHPFIEEQIYRGEDKWDSVSITEIKPNDVILMNVGTKVVNHLAIYLGGDYIAHHAVHRLSVTEKINRWKGFIKGARRLCQE